MKFIFSIRSLALFVFACAGLSIVLADCGYLFDDTLLYFDSYTWVPKYSLGYSPRHPLENRFLDANIDNVAAPMQYPGRMGIYQSLNDTIEVDIRVVNADSVPLVITNLNVESWIEPRVFEIGENIEHATPLAGPPSVKWRVRYWRMPDGTHARPDTLFKRKDYIMKLDVWDVPEGKYQLAILGTDSVPTWFDVMPSSDFYHLLPASSLADSINAWATIFERVMADGDPSNARPWVDSIFAYNANSTVGYYEEAMYAWAKGDSAGVVDAFDAVLERLDKWDDPALPDTTDKRHNGLNLDWKHYMLDLVNRDKEIYINCPEWR